MNKKIAPDPQAAVLYARFSSDNQREESIEAQERAINDYCQRNGLTIVDKYIDRARSATTDRRPEFQRMIAESETGKFSTVVIHKLDRFSRDKFDSANYKRKLKMNGCRVVSVLENLDGSPESIIMESVLEGMAQYYSANLAREVKKGMTETALKCKHTGGLPPTGFRVNKDTKLLEIDEDEAPIVRRIFELYNSGMGYLSICADLNDTAYTTKLGVPFGKNSIRSILVNEKYTGTYIFNRATAHDMFRHRNNNTSKPYEDIIRIEGGCPAIIDKETFEAARERMSKNARAPGRFLAKEPYMLSGIIVCGECGTSFSGNRRYGGRNKLLYVSYRCGQRARDKSCDNKEIRAEYIDGFVLDLLEKHFFTDKAIVLLTAKLNRHVQEQAAQSANVIPQTRKKLETVNRQIDNITAAIADGLYQPSMKDRLDALESEKIKIEADLRLLSEVQPEIPTITEGMIRETLTHFKHFVQTRNIPEVARFISTYVERVEIFKDDVKVTFKAAFAFTRGVEDMTFTETHAIKPLFDQYRPPKAAYAGA